jgi:hypothetical protein
LGRNRGKYHVDCGSLLREPLAILLGGGFLTCAATQLNLDTDQFLKQRGIQPRLGIGKEVPDPRPLAGLPGPFEAVCRGVDPGPV